MEQNLINQLKTLTKFPAVSGNERDCLLWLKEQLAKESRKIYFDRFGNLIALKGNPQIAIFSHGDKVGYMVSKTNNKSVSVVPLASGKALPKKSHWPVVVLAKKPAIGELYQIGERNYHLQISVDKKSLLSITPGDFVALSGDLSVSHGGQIKSQGLDNKLGVLAGCEIFRQCENLALIVTVKEEAFGGGAKTAAWNLKPKTAIILDTTYGDGNKGSTVRVGQGPAICLKDNFLPDRHIVKKFIAVAKTESLPFQLEVIETGGSEASGIHDLNGGIPFVFVGIPIKNMHTPFEAGSVKDLKNTISLLSSFRHKYV